MGGVENVAQAIARRMAADGDEVLVICADEPRHSPHVVDGIPVRRLWWPLKIANTNITPSLPVVLLTESWDVVETHLPTPWSADWSAIVARVLGRGCVLSFYNMIVGEGADSIFAAIYRATAFRLTLRLAHRIIVVSEPWKRYLTEIEPSVSDRIRVIPTGVDVSSFTHGGSRAGRRLLFVGVLDRFHKYKGLDTLLEALAGLDVGYELSIVGDGELRTEYESLARHLGIGSRVRFAGRVTDADLHQEYADSDIYVLPSNDCRHEAGFTLTALEAMASSLPVVIADGAGQIAVEIERSGAGFRTKAGDSVSLRDALRTLLLDQDLRERFGRGARKLVEERYSWDVIVEQRRQIYNQAAKSSRVRRRVE